MKFLDPDQTYDILFAQKIQGQVMSLLTNALGSHGIFGDSICFIDRIVPNPINPWCEDWSAKMFELLKKLSRTFILDDGYLNGSAYGFEPEYQADLPDSLDLEDFLPPSILTVSIPPNSEGTITWQEIEGALTWQEIVELVTEQKVGKGQTWEEIEETLTQEEMERILSWREVEGRASSYCDKLINPIIVTRRRGRFFRNGTKESQTYEFPTANWLHNSVCFDGVELELTSTEAQLLLYDQMDSFLGYLWDELGIPNDCKVLTGCSAKLTSTFRIHTFPRDYPVYFSQGNLPSPQSHVIEYNQPLFNSVPNSYFYVSLIINGENMGKPITTIYDKQNDKLELVVWWNKDYFTNLIENGEDPFAVEISTQFNSQPISGTVLKLSSEMKISSNQGYSFLNQGYGATLDLSPTGVTLDWSIPNTAYTVNSSESLGTIVSEIENEVGGFVLFHASNDKQWRVNTIFKSSHLLPTDLNLFDSGEVALMLNDWQGFSDILQYTSDSTYGTGAPSWNVVFPGWINSYAPGPVGYATWKEFELKHIIKIKINYNEIMQEPNISIEPFLSTSEVAYEFTDNLAYAFTPPSSYLFETMNSSVFLVRSFAHNG
ncbi:MULTISPECIES: hypothetical protein [unclassified Synechocystis]|uniref:hypothetical protein n=1 Tax=unclassified Synechocystis TaxID=2640012 RepID=UPI000420DA06|nr:MULTISPECIES: hypothetical protein [unclassified Synechocystis]AIE73865.1 hypothetical protein D082_13370 [Synechocystis sp. PCC 6714]MCT0252324.1 hypothetical protein [Synechocystis sp. CS-94]